MRRFMKYRWVAALVVVLGVGAAVYVASPAAHAAPPPPGPPNGTIADLQAQIDAQQAQVNALIATDAAHQLQLDQQALLIATKQDIINGTCPRGQHFSQINPDGTFVCFDAELMLQDFNASRHLDPNSVGDVRVACPAGFWPTGGGFDQVGATIHFNGRDGDGWKVSGSTGPFSPGGEIVAKVICAPVKP